MSKLKKLITEIHHRSLWQVLLIYVGAGWACFELPYRGKAATARLLLQEHIGSKGAMNIGRYP